MSDGGSPSAVGVLKGVCSEAPRPGGDLNEVERFRDAVRRAEVRSSALWRRRRLRLRSACPGSLLSGLQLSSPHLPRRWLSPLQR